jgi:hypothetical protein
MFWVIPNRLKNSHRLPSVKSINQAMESGFEGAPIIVIIIFSLIALVGFGLWLWSLIHCIQNRYLSDNNRLIGILLIVLLGLIGSLVYLFLPKETEPQR